MTNSQSPGSPPSHNRRRARSHFIHQGLRLRLVLDDTLFALIAALVAIGLLYFLSNREIGDNLYSAHFSIKETKELLTNGVKIAGIVTFVAVLLFGIWSVVDAHRIAGPMHRLQRLLNEMADGNLNHEIRFRRRDEFQEMAQAADRLVDTYVERLARVRQEADAIRQALQQDALPEAQVAELRRHGDELLRQLDYFQLPNDGSGPAVDNSPLT
ncbi:MAG TPA: methyl-accepting chemotaxis protein [Chthonomonadaceae bacterium]|nr:methyl-accepting chemotaxis protein [Chthonomonadaceae bacterium]